MIVERKLKMLGVMLTKGRKNLTFMLLVFCSSSGVTVVVVLLIALKQDMARWCRGLEIRVGMWNSKKLLDKMQIMLVMPEGALTDGFNSFLNWLRRQGQLERMVVDKCYVVLNKQKDFRPKLKELGQLNVVMVQMVYLMVMLLVGKEKKWFEQMELREQEVTGFRSKTMKKNIKYRIYEMKKKKWQKQEKELLGLMKGKVEKLKGKKNDDVL